MSIKVERIREKIKVEVARIIQHELKDPRRGFVTVMGCELSHDLRHAKVKVSVLADKEGEVRRVMRMLDDARAFVQRTVAGRLRTRVTPELRFELDRSVERSVKISSLLDDLRKERETREGGGAALEVSDDLVSGDQTGTDADGDDADADDADDADDDDADDVDDDDADDDDADDD